MRIRLSESMPRVEYLLRSEENVTELALLIEFCNKLVPKTLTFEEFSLKWDGVGGDYAHTSTNHFIAALYT